MRLNHRGHGTQFKLATATTEGVAARLLLGNHRKWSVTDGADIDGGEALATKR